MNRRLFAAGLLAALLFGGAGLAQAQVRPVADLRVVIGFPQGEFKDNVSNVGIGLDGFFGLGLGRSPVIVGADLGFMIYGFERRREPFSTTIPDVTVDVETSNSIFLGHMVLRLQPSYGPVQPYFDALFGLKYFFTETTIEDDDFFDSEPIASTTNFDDAALSYGIGGGVGIEVLRGPGGRKLRGLLIHGGARYLLGTEASYLQEGSIERRNGRVFFTIDRSETTMLLVHLGVTLKF